MHQTISHKFSLLLIAGLFLSACSKPEYTLKDSDFTGAYALVSVNGNPTPTNITHEAASLQVRLGVFTINADGTCSTRTVFVPPSGTEIAREVSATYTKDGSKLTMQWKGAGITVGTIQGNIFTMDNEGMQFVYKK
jgi:hypothetical protein